MSTPPPAEAQSSPSPAEIELSTRSNPWLSYAAATVFVGFVVAGVVGAYVLNVRSTYHYEIGESLKAIQAGISREPLPAGYMEEDFDRVSPSMTMEEVEEIPSIRLFERVSVEPRERGPRWCGIYDPEFNSGPPEMTMPTLERDAAQYWVLYFGTKAAGDGVDIGHYRRIDFVDGVVVGTARTIAESTDIYSSP